MKTVMQQLIEWIEKNETGKIIKHLSSEEIHKKCFELLEKEKEQIVSSFDMGKSRAYATADGECEAKFGFEFYNETYTDNDKDI